MYDFDDDGGSLTSNAHLILVYTNRKTKDETRVPEKLKMKQVISVTVRYLQVFGINLYKFNALWWLQ